MTIREVALTSEEMRRIKDEFDKSIADHDKRIRAEVLAACSKYLEKIAERYGLDSLMGRELLQGAESIKTEVQPAASALEELLREARQDEIRQFLNKLPPLGALKSVESLEDWIHKRMDYLTEREFELEKAHVITEDK